MKIKIGDIVYDSELCPIMLILSEEEKEWIKNMPGSKFCSYPDSDKYTTGVITDFMKIEEK